MDEEEVMDHYMEYIRAFLETRISKPLPSLQDSFSLHHLRLELPFLQIGKELVKDSLCYEIL